VDQSIEDLADFVRRTREAANLSTRDVAKRSGNLISHGYVSQIENRTGLGSGVSPGRLLGLARGLGVPIEEVMAAAVGSQSTVLAAQHIRLLGFFNSLPEDKQHEALDFLEMFSRRYGMNGSK
jgi:transcriptional regulator with XRE-family HTH domain